MSTYKEKLDYTEETKNLIKDAIVAKGVAVAPEDTFRSYATKIGEIQGGGGPELPQAPKITCWDTYQNGGWTGQIKSIDWTEFNKLGVTDMGSMFVHYAAKTLDIANLSTTGVTSMYLMFTGCENLTSLDLSNFDTSKVTDMSYMFNNCNNLTSLDLSSFDTSKVKGMTQMFAYCNKLTSLDLSNFDTSKVTIMDNMFNNCSNLTSLDLSNFDTSKVTSMDGIFDCIGTRSSAKEVSITFGNNWASNNSINEINANTGYSWASSNSKLSKESVLDLFNKLATRNNNPVVNVAFNVYDVLTPDEMAIAQNKGWTVTRAE